MADEIIEEETNTVTGISMAAINTNELGLAVGDIGARNIFAVIKAPDAPGMAIVVFRDEYATDPISPIRPWPPIHVD